MKILKKMNKILCFTLVLCVILAANILEVSASSTNPKIQMGSNSSTLIRSIFNDINRGYGTILSCSNDGIVSFDPRQYNNLSTEEKIEFMKNALSTVRSSTLGAKSKNQLYNFIANQDTTTSQAIRYLTEDTTTDLATARKWLRPFSSGISIVTGVLSILIFVFLGMSVIFDIAYLALPAFQLILEKGESHKKPFGVSAEAWKVNREIAGDIHNKKNIISEYMKRRVGVILAIAVCIGYLISGKIYDVLTYFASAFSSI